MGSTNRRDRRIPVAAPIGSRAVIMARRRAIFPCRSSRPEDDPPQDAVAVEHGGDALFDDHGDRLAHVLAPDGALETTALDVTAPVEAAGADLLPLSPG